MALAGSVLESSASVIASVQSLQCVKCKAVFRAVKTKYGSRCLTRGSSIIIGGLELQTSNKPVQPSLYKLTVFTGYGGEGTDGYYLVMEDSGRVDKMMDQLMGRLQVAVRSTPIPLTRRNSRERVYTRSQTGYSTLMACCIVVPVPVSVQY